MTEIFPTERWDSEKYGEHKEWVRVFILLKGTNLDHRSTVLTLFKKIIDILEEKNILKSFHFLWEPFPEEAFNKEELEQYKDKYPRVLDMRIWLIDDTSIEEVKEIIRREFIEIDIVDFLFWYFPEKHLNYCKDENSDLYYNLICRIYELFCRFQFEKSDPSSTKNLNVNGFSNWKTVHCFLNSQGFDSLGEAMFGICYAYERLGFYGEKYGDVKSLLLDALHRLNLRDVMESYKDRYFL